MDTNSKGKLKTRQKERQIMGGGASVYSKRVKVAFS